MIQIEKRKKGQTVVEMALFAALILLILGTLLSYLQGANERQYVQMETFRRALERACNYRPAGGGAGAAVAMTLKQDRRLVDLSGNYKKGAVQPFMANSNVFWAVPYVGNEVVSLVHIKANEDDYEVVRGKDYKGFSDIETDQQTDFSETTIKEEDTGKIVNINKSKLQDTITTRFIYDPKDDEEAEPGAQEAVVWEVTQGAYRGADGQYKFDDAQVGTVIERGKTWETEF